jgi:hypothetical protein
MHTEPLCPYCKGSDFTMKDVSLSQSAEKAKLIFCASCGKTIGPVSDYDMILEAIDGRLIELLDRR